MDKDFIILKGDYKKIYDEIIKQEIIHTRKSNSEIKMGRSFLDNLFYLIFKIVKIPFLIYVAIIKLFSKRAITSLEDLINDLSKTPPTVIKCKVENTLMNFLSFIPFMGPIIFLFIIGGAVPIIIIALIVFLLYKLNILLISYLEKGAYSVFGENADTLLTIWDKIDSYVIILLIIIPIIRFIIKYRNKPKPEVKPENFNNVPEPLVNYALLKFLVKNLGKNKEEIEVKIYKDTKQQDIFNYLLENYKFIKYFFSEKYTFDINKSYKLRFTVPKWEMKYEDKIISLSQRVVIVEEIKKIKHRKYIYYDEYLNERTGIETYTECQDYGAVTVSSLKINDKTIKAAHKIYKKGKYVLTENMFKPYLRNINALLISKY